MAQAMTLWCLSPIPQLTRISMAMASIHDAMQVVSRYIHYFMHEEAHIIARRTFLWLHDTTPQPWWDWSMQAQDGCPVMLYALPGKQST